MDAIENIEQTVGLPTTGNRFIEANTIEATLEEVREKHIIPVFTKFNEPLISHSDFVGAVNDVIVEHYPRELILSPNIRLSHPIKGRIPEAKHKPAKDLEEHEKTVYFERMAFMVEIPTISDEVGGNDLCLTVGGVKAYNLDNYNSNRKDQRFKVFIGFKNSVCTNLCINTDGLLTDITVRNIWDLKNQVRELIAEYNPVKHIEGLRPFGMQELQELQAVHLIGRLKMYNYLPAESKRTIPNLRLTDGQLNYVADSYYNDPNFQRGSGGSISLWNLYNCFTGAMKTSYIDSYLEKVAGVHQFVSGMSDYLQDKNDAFGWHLRN